MAKKRAAPKAAPAAPEPGGAKVVDGILVVECGFPPCGARERFYCSAEERRPRPTDKFPLWRFGNRDKDTRCPTCANYGR